MIKLQNLFKILAIIVIFSIPVIAQPPDQELGESCDPRLQKALENRLGTLELKNATALKDLSSVNGILSLKSTLK